MSQRAMIVTAAVVVVVALVAWFSLGGGNAVAPVKKVGSTAISVTAAGTPVLLIAVCSESADTVSIHEGREGLSDDEPNPEVADFTATTPIQGLVTLDLTSPGAGWNEHDPVTMKDDTHYVIETFGDDTSAGKVDFLGRDLKALSPSQVIVGEANVEKRATFEASCR